MRSFYFLRTLIAVHPNRDSLVGRPRLDAVCLQTKPDPFSFENFLNGVGYVIVLTADDSIVHLYNRDLAAESAIHLGELQPNVTAADDNQVFR